VREIEKGGKTYNLYTEEEYLLNIKGESDVVIKQGVSTDTADYIISQDGFVVPILKTYCLDKRSKRFYYSTPLGYYFPFTGRGVLHTDADKFVSGLKNPNNESEMLTDKQRHFCLVYARTREKARAYKEAFQVGWKRNVLINEANKLLKLKKVQNYVDELTRKALNELSVDQEWVVKQLKEVVEKPTTQGNKLSALKEFIELLEMKKKISIRTTHQLPVSREEILGITGNAIATDAIAEVVVEEEQ